MSSALTIYRFTKYLEEKIQDKRTSLTTANKHSGACPFKNTLFVHS
jgi:hypothetical protein